METVVREYSPEHRGALARLVSELHDALKELAPENVGSGAEVGERYTDHLLATVAEKSGIVYLALVNEEIVGFAAAYKRRPEGEPQENYYISDLLVTDGYRDRGIGKLLLSKVEEFARNAGVSYLRVTSLANNLGARRLYEAVGFSELGINFQKKL